MPTNGTATLTDPAAPCPFLASSPGRCQAAFASAGPKRGRLARRCQSDEHDNCPLFMARLLRSSPVERVGAVVNLHLK